MNCPDISSAARASGYRAGRAISSRVIQAGSPGAHPWTYVLYLPKGQNGRFFVHIAFYVLFKISSLVGWYSSEANGKAKRSRDAVPIEVLVNGPAPLFHA